MRMDFSTIQAEHNAFVSGSSHHRYLIVLKGKGSLKFDNECYDLSTHDFVELPSNTDCFFESHSDGPYSSMLLGVIELPNLINASHKIMMIPAKDTELIRRVFYLGLDVQGVEGVHLDAVQEALQRLMHEVVISVGLSSKSMNEQVHDIIREINMRFTDPDFDVTIPMQKTGYSINHLRKLFKDETGVTPAEFVNIRRMDKAGELFRQVRKRIPIKDIALQCGYLDPYYFSRQFKAYYGVSPQKYIDQL